MPAVSVDDNGDGSVLVRPDQMSDVEFTALMPRKQHPWQTRVWFAATPDKQPEKHMGALRKAVWIWLGV